LHAGSGRDGSRWWRGGAAAGLDADDAGVEEFCRAFDDGVIGDGGGGGWGLGEAGEWRVGSGGAGDPLLAELDGCALAADGGDEEFEIALICAGDFDEVSGDFEDGQAWSERDGGEFGDEGFEGAFDIGGKEFGPVRGTRR